MSHLTKPVPGPAGVVGEEFTDEIAAAPLPRDGVIKARAAVGDVSQFHADGKTYQFHACDRVEVRSRLICSGCQAEGPGHVTEALVLNRCVKHDEEGLTWEAGPGNAELAVAELGLQATRQQTCPRAAPADAALENEVLHADGQKTYHGVSCVRLVSETRYSAQWTPPVALTVVEQNWTHGWWKSASWDQRKRKGAKHYSSWQEE